MATDYTRSRQKNQKQTTRDQWEVEVRNLPEHIIKEDIAYYLWKSLQGSHALLRHGNPIIQLNLLPTQRVLRLNFRSQQQANNCLLLDHIYFVLICLQREKKFFLSQVDFQLQIKKLKIVKNEVQDKFRQIYVGNLPYMNSMQILNYLSEFGELRSFIDQTKDTNSSACLCQYINDQQTQQALKKLDNSKLKGRSVIAKRATLMKTKQASKTKIMPTISKGTRFESLDQMYMTFDTEGFFRNKLVSCVLLLKGIIPATANVEAVLKDIKNQVQKIGPLVRTTHKNLNVYLQYESVQYSQIAFLLISKRKYDGKDIQVLFYNPIKFADDILI